MNAISFKITQNFIGLGQKLFSVFEDKTECYICGTLCKNIPICKDCARFHFSIEKIDSGLCKICGKKLISEKEFCSSCRNDPLLKHTDAVYPLFPYALWNTSLLCLWKISGERRLSKFFAEKLYQRLLQVKEIFGEFVLVPVPPRKGKIRECGWDQVEELARFLEFYSDIRICRCLQRFSSKEQKKLGREGRLENIDTAYGLSDEFIKKKISIPNKVCILDDVITTGSTIESCARALKKAGSEQVIAVSLFTVI